MRQAKQAMMQEIGKAKANNAGAVLQIAKGILNKYVEPMREANRDKLVKAVDKIKEEYRKVTDDVRHKVKLLETLNPEKVLRQGYAILSGKISPGEMIGITTSRQEIEAEIKKIKERK